MSNDVLALVSKISQATLGPQESAPSSQPSQSPDANPQSEPAQTEAAVELAEIRHPPPPRTQLSLFSTPAVPDSAWCAHDFLLGAGMVIIQKNTHKIVVIYETKLKYWFFPRGRKDVGESIEQAAFREAYEESGFRVQPLPLLIPTRQPRPPQGSKPRIPVLNTEPIYMTLAAWQPRRTALGELDDGGEYLTTWFAGQIEQDAVPETGTGMPDEQNFQSHLLSIEEAEQKVLGAELAVLEYVWRIYVNTIEAYRRQAEQNRLRAEQRRAQASSGPLTIRTHRKAESE